MSDSYYTLIRQQGVNAIPVLYKSPASLMDNIDKVDEYLTENKLDGNIDLNQVDTDLPVFRIELARDCIEIWILHTNDGVIS